VPEAAALTIATPAPPVLVFTDVSLDVDVAAHRSRRHVPVPRLEAAT